MQIVKSDHALVAAVSKPRIILEPVYATDFAAVPLALVILRAIQRVVVVNVGVTADTDGEEMTAMAETHLLTVLQSQTCVVID